MNTCAFWADEITYGGIPGRYCREYAQERREEGEGNVKPSAVVSEIPGKRTVATQNKRNGFIFTGHLIALSILGIIIFLTISPLRYVPGTPAYLAHGVTLTLSVYISLFASIISIHLVVNSLRRKGISGILHNSSILTLAFMVVLIIGALCNLFLVD